MSLMTSGSSGLSSQYQTLFDKDLLKHAMPLLVTSQFAQKRPFPKNKGAKTIRFFRPGVADRTRVSTLVEGVPIANFSEVTLSTVEATLVQSGQVMKISDILSMTDLIDTLENSSRQMGEDAAAFTDFTCVQEVVTGVGSGGKRYAGTATDFASLHALTNANGKLQIVDLLGAFTKLTLNKAMKPEGGAYATILAPNQGYDVMQDTKFVDAGIRGNNDGLFNGKIGTWYGNAIHVTTEEWIEDGAGSEGTYVANPSEKIFSAMVLGRDYFGAPIMAGNSPFSPSVITRKGADSGDPLGQSQSVGWKAYWTAKVLNDTWAVIIRSKSTFA